MKPVGNARQKTLSGAVHRRTLLTAGGVVLAGGVAAGADALFSGTSPAAERLADQPSAAGNAPPPDVDLFEEHGVLKRILLIYQEAARRIDAGQQPPASAIHDSALIIQDFVENLHESLENGFVFPKLRVAGMLSDTIDTLLMQHARGRELTQAILAGSSGGALNSAATRTEVAGALSAFVRMYEPHEAREDTVVFPAFRSLLTADELTSTAAIFTDIQNGKFGPNGFDDIVNQVASIEQGLGIYDLAQFTP